MNNWNTAGLQLETMARAGILVEISYVPQHRGKEKWQASYDTKASYNLISWTLPIFWGESGPEVVQKAFLAWQKSKSAELDKIDYNI